MNIRICIQNTSIYKSINIFFTLSNLLTHHNGYTVSTGVLSSEMHTGIESLPLDTDETMTLGYILHGDRATSPLVEHYIRCLEKQIAAYSVSNDITQQ